MSGPLPRRGFLWQRHWTPPVIQAIEKSDEQLDGVILLGAEIVQDHGAPKCIEASIQWETLNSLKKPCALAVRVAPVPELLDSAVVRSEIERLLGIVRAKGVRLTEIVLDLDCPQKRLDAYRSRLKPVRAALGPYPLVITALPAWLEEPEFARLAREVDRYILQVHSVPMTGSKGQPVLCDPAVARKSVILASRIGVPFSVALPTYRCVAGYDPTGKLLGVAMDSVQPAWPADTRLLNFEADQDQLADLVEGWKRRRPQWFRELIWYRVPVETDARNWGWTTLAAVMQGRRPVHRLEVRQSGENPVDLSLINSGESDAPLHAKVTVSSADLEGLATDALPGWTVRQEAGRVVFETDPGVALRLSPGTVRDMGWVRYAKTPRVAIQVEELP